MFLGGKKFVSNFEDITETKAYFAEFETSLTLWMGYRSLKIIEAKYINLKGDYTEELNNFKKLFSLFLHGLTKQPTYTGRSDDIHSQIPTVTVKYNHFIFYTSNMPRIFSKWREG